MKFADAVTVIDAACSAGVPVNLRGAPGIGKTSIVAAVAETRGRHLETVLVSIREPADFAGLPIISPDGTTIMSPPRWARTIADSDRPCMVFFDELNTAPPAVQAATLRVLTEGWVGDLQLPASVWYVAAMNAVEQSAGGWDLAPPLANRMLHLEVAADVDTWTAGMLTGWKDAPSPLPSTDPSADSQAAVIAAVAGFIAANHGILSAVPDSPAAAAQGWPSPRTWDYVTRVLPRIPAEQPTAAMAAVAGLVGPHAAVEFFTWRDEADLPDPSKVLADPSVIDWDDRADRLVAVLNSLVAYTATTANDDDWAATAEVMHAAVDRGMEDLAALVVRPFAAIMPKGQQLDRDMMAKFAPILSRAGKIA